MEPDGPPLSVVIPTLDRPRWVVAVVDDAMGQLPDAGELVVVDQSEGESVEAVARYLADVGDPRARHLVLEDRGLPAARNVGIAATTGRVVLFLDDDVSLAPGCLDAHLRAFDDARTGGVVGRILERRVRANTRRTANRIGAGGRVLTNLEGTRRTRIQTLKGANMSLRRAALEQVGGFDVAYRGTALLEDADISVRIARAGWALWFEPAAEVVHHSAPRGGVRVGDPQTTERWRFHNTAYFVRRHRGWSGWPALIATFTAIAGRRALQWGDPAAVRRLLGALRQGWARGGAPASSAQPGTL